MKVTFRRAGRVAAALVAFGALGAASACAPGGAPASGGITLVVETFGNFGYKGLLREYEAANPGIRVVERITEYQEHHAALTERLDAGSGTGDVVAIEEGFTVQFLERHQDFHNLLDHGAGDLADRWLPWKWQQTLTSDGTYQIGFGTDVGGLAMCYRPDLFAAAGLPTGREEVAALWPTWNDYIDAGRRFTAADLPAQWTDSASNVFNQIMAQQEVGYFDHEERLQLGPDGGVRRSWDLTIAMVDSGASAKYVPYQHQWTAALQGGRFATLTCPAWVLGWIQNNAPAARGMWDIAQVPGGAGNWGGSWLAVPKQSGHPAEAYALARWLTAPEQQLRIFQETGNLPSLPELYDAPELRDYTSPFFLDAPVGRIFTAAAQQKQVQHLGRYNGQARAVFERHLARYETGAATAEEAWRDATAEVRALVDRGTGTGG